VRNVMRESVECPCAMDDSSYRLNFDLGKKKKSISTTRKSILILVKLQSLVAKCCKMGKI
jgi:hypothetical protein